jgi:methyl-accepting chemotaxis protein
MLDGTTSFADAVAELVPDASLLPRPTRFSLVEAAAVGPDRTGLDAREAGRLAEDLAAGVQAGSIEARSVVGRITWRRLADGRVLIGVPGEGGARAASTRLYLLLLVAVVLAGSVGLAVAYLMGDDFRRATDALVAEAERMAAGDLSRGRVWEAEDEMGGLGRAFERMGAALRTTVGRVTEAADRVDAAASEIASVSQSVAVASADQVRRIQQANELMLQIRDQVSGVSESAQALNVSVEESSSSILELGAAGDELNDTASVLSSKVDEVSGSIEQMVRSVKQVGSTAEGLSDAAAETSSSMEEMASAMRAVDNTAELTANLSNDVVSLAESGQQKVSETIQGMEAIRDATDAAERVIRGLGSRAMEIGGILDVIDDVADETNLLALNAAIIAAQAGEHGRAFSVVADEIKELADRVLASTKEIGGLIRSVQEESDNAVGAIEAGSASVATGVERSAEAGSALEEITRAARESGDRIGQIVGAVREQTKATTHVVGLMEGVRTGVEQISMAGSEQDRANEVVYRSAVTMREVAQQVRRTTEEQSRGFSRIRESVEGVREAVERINTSLQEQTNACTQVASFLEQVFDGTRSNEEAAQRMGTSMRDLLSQAEALREDVAKFRI